MGSKAGFFPGAETPDAGWWEALWPEPAMGLACLGLRSGMAVVDQPSDVAPIVLSEGILKRILKRYAYSRVETGHQRDLIASPAGGVQSLRRA